MAILNTVKKITIAILIASAPSLVIVGLSYYSLLITTMLIVPIYLVSAFVVYLILKKYCPLFIIVGGDSQPLVKQQYAQVRFWRKNWIRKDWIHLYAFIIAVIPTRITLDIVFYAKSLPNVGHIAILMMLINVGIFTGLSLILIFSKSRVTVI